MDEGDSHFLYCGRRPNCYHYVRSSNYLSRRLQSKYRLANVLKREGVYGLYNMWYIVSTFCLNFSIDVPWHPLVTLCRRRFSYIFTSKDDKRPFHPYFLYGNHDDNLLYFSFHYSARKSWMVIPAICLAIVPVTNFAWTQSRLLYDMLISTYCSRILDRKAKTGSKVIQCATGCIRVSWIIGM